MGLTDLLFNAYLVVAAVAATFLMVKEGMELADRDTVEGLDYFSAMYVSVVSALFWPFVGFIAAVRHITREYL